MGVSTSLAVLNNMFLNFLNDIPQYYLINILFIAVFQTVHKVGELLKKLRYFDAGEKILLFLARKMTFNPAGIFFTVRYNSEEQINVFLLFY